MKYSLGLTGEPINDRIIPELSSVGIIRSDYLCRLIEEYISLESCRKYITNYTANICKIFNKDEVWYVTTDLVTPEVNVLKGADHLIEEKHYAFGLRGIRRSLMYKDTFIKELELISKLHDKYNNLNVLFPFVSDVKEIKEGVKLLKKVGFKGKYGITIDTPSSALTIENFIDMGVSNFTFRHENMATLLMGTYSRSQYDIPTHNSVTKLLERVIEKCKVNKIPLAVGGYITKDLDSICRKMNVDTFIVHYHELPSIFKINKTKLPYIDNFEKIKLLTKSRIKEREIGKWADYFKENDFVQN